jgi:hypothetical protein
MNLNKINIYFILLIFLPLLLIALSANFNFIDTSNYFFKTLLSGKFFYMYSADWPYYNPITHENRFQPFVGLFQNVTLLFDLYKNEKTIYFVQLIIFLISVIFTFKTINKNNIFVYLVFFSFILSPPFIFSFFQPLLTESVLFFFISIYIFFLKKILHKISLINIILLIILIPIIILSKISSIILLLSINSFLIFFSIKLKNKFYSLFFISCLIFSILSYFLLLFYTGKAPDKLYNPINFIFYYTTTDYIIFYIYFICLTSIVYEYNNYKALSFQNSLSITLLFTSFLYFVALIIFGKHSEYQQLICYLLVIPYLVSLNFSNKYFRKTLVIASTFFVCLPIIYTKDFFKILIIFFFIKFFLIFFKKKFSDLYKNYVVIILISLSLFYLIIPGISLSYHRYIIGKNIENVIKNIDQKKINNSTQIFLHSTNNNDCSESIMHNFIFNERLSYIFKKDYVLFVNPINNINECKKDLEYFEENYALVNDHTFANYKHKNLSNEPDIIISNYYDDVTNFNKFLLMNNIDTKKYKFTQYEYNKIWSYYYKIVSKISSFRKKSPLVFLLQKKIY